MNHRELIAALTPLHGAGEARAIVRMVMEERFGLSQVDLLLGKDSAFSADDREEWRKIASRLLAGEPVQHVLGFADFCGHRFRVSPDVLIPRPETEELVAWAVEEGTRTASSREGADFRVLDLCTGSGCIAISLALAFPESRVTGIDISEPALRIARQNAQDLQAENVEFSRQDVLGTSLEGVAPHSCSLLVSNPPYVRPSEKSGMTATVLDYEPHLALFAPAEDPLLFYRAIARIGRDVLRKGAPLQVEVNSALGEETKWIFLDSGYDSVELRADQFGRPRMLKAVLVA